MPHHARYCVCTGINLGRSSGKIKNTIFLSHSTESSFSLPINTTRRLLLLLAQLHCRMKRITTIKWITMAISIHGRAAVDDSMLLYRAAHRFALFHLFPVRARIDKTHQPPKMPNHVVTMADVQSRGWWWRVYNLFFPSTRIGADTNMCTPPSQSNRIYIWLGALSLIYRRTQFSTFPCTSCNYFSTCTCFGREEKMATSYHRTCTRSPVVSDMSRTIMRLKCRGAATKITILRDIWKI